MRERFIQSLQSVIRRNDRQIPPEQEGVAREQLSRVDAEGMNEALSIASAVEMGAMEEGTARRILGKKK